MLFVSLRVKHKQWYLFIHVCCRPIFTFEIYLPSERAFFFGAETSQAQRKWTEAIAKVMKYYVFTLNPENALNLGSVVELQRAIEILHKILGKMSILN